MSKVNENGFLSGHTGNMVLRELNGQQVMQSMPSHYNDRNSEAQQKQRSGMRNIIAFYRVVKDVIKKQFEEATSYKRPYNCFTHHNILLPAIDLPKDEYEKGLCKLAPYVVSHGSLKSLDLQVIDGKLQFQMKADEWKKGDILRFVKINSNEASTDEPAVLMAEYEDKTIETPEDKLIVSEALTHGGCAYIHIRNTRKGTLVSTQQLILL